ncbi:hypothetical protein JCM10213v2_007860 [Rhodosporidiobolus nylandii]
MIALPGGDFAVTGPDARMLLEELHRLRISVAQKRRRRTAYLAGALSLIVLIVTVWYLVEAAGSLIAKGGKGRGALRYVDLAFCLVVLASWPVILLFLRSRRISRLALAGLVSAALSAFLHFSLAFTNFILAFVWKDELDGRCDWGIGVDWALGDKGEVCATSSFGWRGWAVAAAVRLTLTTILLVVWLFTLRRYNLALHTPFRIDPSALPSSELRSLLERHRADIVPLSSAHPLHAHHPHDGHGADYLPSMPDRAAHYALVSEGEESQLYSYRGSEHTRNGSGANADDGGKGGVGAWVGAKFWGGVGYLFGVQPYSATSSSPEEEEKGDPEKRAGGLRRPLDREEDGFDPVALEDPHDLEARHAFSASFLAPHPQNERQEYRSLFSDLRRPPSSSSLSFSSKRHSASTVASASPLLHRPLSGPEEADDPANERDLPAPPPPAKDLPSHGSSGSSNGAIVYVRMTDGRLVRRLSTIASLSEAGASSASLANPQAYMHRSHSTLDPSSGSGSRSGSESFATAAEVLAYHQAEGGEQEVLILDETSGEVVEDWRRRRAERA